MTAPQPVATPGIMGGMGPAATLELMRRVLRLTPGTVDQDHIPVLLYNNPQVPSRTKAVLENGPSPAPVLVAMARKLHRMGADFLVLPCNSAHLYLPQIAEAVDIPVLSMIELVRHQVDAHPPGVVGLLATTNTVQTGLYETALAAHKPLYLTGHEQGDLMALIADVKAGQVGTASHTRCLDFVRLLSARGAATIILGCTELSLVAPQEQEPASVIDPLDLLARAVVDVALGRHDASDLLPDERLGSADHRRETAVR